MSALAQRFLLLKQNVKKQETLILEKITFMYFWKLGANVISCQAGGHNNICLCFQNTLHGQKF